MKRALIKAAMWFVGAFTVAYVALAWGSSDEKNKSDQLSGHQVLIASLVISGVIALWVFFHGWHHIVEDEAESRGKRSIRSKGW